MNFITQIVDQKLSTPPSFLLMVLRFELRTVCSAWSVLYHFSHAPSPFLLSQVQTNLNPFALGQTRTIILLLMPPLLLGLIIYYYAWLIC
jgi:hypothetical protein